MPTKLYQQIKDAVDGGKFYRDDITRIYAALKAMGGKIDYFLAEFQIANRSGSSARLSEFLEHLFTLYLKARKLYGHFQQLPEEVLLVDEDLQALIDYDALDAKETKPLALQLIDELVKRDELLMLAFKLISENSTIVAGHQEAFVRALTWHSAWEYKHYEHLFALPIDGNIAWQLLSSSIDKAAFHMCDGHNTMIWAGQAEVKAKANIIVREWQSVANRLNVDIYKHAYSAVAGQCPHYVPPWYA